MIVSAILGGIGNQMFQYSAGRALALARNEPLLVDLTGFDGYGLHQGYELQRVFELEVESAEREQIKEFLGWRSSSVLLKFLKRQVFANLRGRHLAIEPHFNFWPELASMGSPLYIMGYWQSARYFGSYEEQIRDDFRFRHPLQGRNAELASEMANGLSVSLHIRRGDYVTHKATTKIMELCSLEYYREAVRYMSSHLHDPVFFVFSDDMEWAKQSLNFNPKFVFVEQNSGLESYRDMQLMGTCQHHIIANSSFSWWGAWLNPNPDKLVIAPRRWFRNGMNDSDLIPTQWIRL